MSCCGNANVERKKWEDGATPRINRLRDQYWKNLPEMDDEELAMQKLWKLFYDTIAIKERYNPKCRMSFLPKRTWDLLPEMKDL